MFTLGSNWQPFIFYEYVWHWKCGQTFLEFPTQKLKKKIPIYCLTHKDKRKKKLKTVISSFPVIFNHSLNVHREITKSNKALKEVAEIFGASGEWLLLQLTVLTGYMISLANMPTKLIWHLATTVSHWDAGYRWQQIHKRQTKCDLSLVKVNIGLSYFLWMTWWWPDRNVIINVTVYHH